MAEAQQIIIKRVKKVAGGHHGGAWKVAYADFVTAMMAFFLLLWLLNAVTEEQLTGISNYFAPSMASQSNTGAGGLLGGQVIGQGAMSSRTSSPSLMQHVPPSSIGPGGEDLTSSMTEPLDGMGDKDYRDESEFKEKSQLDAQGMERAELAQREEVQFEQAKKVLESAVKGIPELKKFEGSFMVDNTPEGLRIQITDQEGLAMFPSASSAMYGHTRALLDLVSRVINQMPNVIAIEGHTDGIPFRDPNGYSNWELSADRALASRRALIASGVPETRVNRVVGKADTDPLVKDDNKAPRNRRISIILLRENEILDSEKLPPAPMPLAPGPNPAP